MEENLLQVCVKSIIPQLGDSCIKRHLYWKFIPKKKTNKKTVPPALHFVIKSVSGTDSQSWLNITIT